MMARAALMKRFRTTPAAGSRSVSSRRACRKAISSSTPSPYFGLALCRFLMPQDLGDLLAAAEEVDALNVAPGAADRAGGHDLAAGYLARLHERVADVLQMPAPAPRSARCARGRLWPGTGACWCSD